MQDKIIITRKEQITPTHKAEHEPFEFFKYEATPRAGFDQCYVCFYELPPQKSNYPYHYHTQNTEAFYILSGKGILLAPGGEKRISAGDLILCPPGEQSAHRIANASKTEPLVYLDFDTANSPDILHYPHSGKTGIITRGQKSVFFKENAPVEYYEGE